MLDLVKLWISKGMPSPACLKKEEHYFAFGANLSSEILHKRRMNPIRSEAFALDNHVLEFTQAGPYEGSAFATVRSKQGSCVYGQIMTLQKIDMLRMHFFEVVPFLRKHRVIFFEQKEKKAQFYQATTETPGLNPTRVYLDIIHSHAAENPLATPEYVKNLANQPVSTSTKFAKDMYFAIDYRSTHGLLQYTLRIYDQLIARLFKILVNLHTFRHFI